MKKENYDIRQCGKFDPVLLKKTPKTYHRASWKDAVRSASGYASREGVPFYLYATYSGVKLSRTEPDLPRGNNFVEVRPDGKINCWDYSHYAKGEQMQLFGVRRKAKRGKR